MDVRKNASFVLERAKAYGADAAETMGYVSSAVSADCRLGKTEALEYAQTQGVDLRVFCGRRQAVLSTSVTDDKALDDMARRAVDMARVLPEDEFCGLADAAQQHFAPIDLDVRDMAVPTSETLIERAKEAEDAALSVKGITNSDGASASFSDSTVFLMSSTGFERQTRRTRSALGVSVLTENPDGTKERDGDDTTAVFASDMRSGADVGKTAAMLTLKKRGSVKIASMTAPVVLAPRVARGFIGHFLGAINGVSAAKKTTFLADMLGKQVFRHEINIVENPLLRRGLASRFCDAEGIACRPLSLVDGGVMTTWLLDLYSARRMGLSPTGHAVRGFGGLPGPAPSNVTLTAGKATPEDLMADIRLGLYVTDVFGQGVNGVTGDYSRGAAGFLIENGRLTIPVHEVTIAGNLKDLFLSMTAANDVTTDRAVNAPTVRLENVSVAGK